MTNGKKPSDQIEQYRRERRFTEMEDKIQDLKRSVNVLRICLILQAAAIILNTLK